MIILQIIIGYILGKWLYVKGLKLLIFITFNNWYKLPIYFQFDVVGNFCIWRRLKKAKGIFSQKNVIILIRRSFIDSETKPQSSW